MIAAERRGDSSGVAELAELANAFYRLKYESSIALYVKQYPIFG